MNIKLHHGLKLSEYKHAENSENIISNKYIKFIVLL